MGKLVAFWSPYAGKSKVTSSMCAVAGMFGAEYPEHSIAISHIGSDCMELGEKLDYRCGSNIKKEVYGKSGITSLKLTFRQVMLTTEKVRRSAIPLIMKSLFFYPNVEEIQNNELTNYILTKIIKNEFDAVFLDLKSGINPCSRYWIEEADLVVVVLPQEPKTWESFELYETEYLTGKKYFVLLGGYLEKSKFNRNRYLSRTLGKIQGELIGVMPISIGFFDAMAEGRTLDFFYKNQKVRKKEENYEFIFQTKKVVRVLRKYIFFQDLKMKILQMLQDYTEMSAKEVGLTEAFLESQEEHRRMISYCIRSCNSGNRGARETVLELIDTYLVRELQIRREEWLRLIPFHEPERMNSWQQLEVLIYSTDYKKEYCGFEYLCEQYGWGKDKCTVSKEEILQVYMDQNPVLTCEDERKILVQLLYAETVGLGMIDTLNYQTGYIEEIQIGMNGNTEQLYDYNDYFREKKGKNFGIAGIHIMVKGSTIWLKALSFESETEVQRVLRNLVQSAGGDELTKNHPMMVADTTDGRRISVSRPPMTDSWVGLIRKFDTIKEVSLEKLYSDYESEKMVPLLLRQLIRSGRNIAITGEMASGKTTLFRACLAETRPDMNIRVIEADSFELNVRGFLPWSNTLTMRVTEKTPSEEVLAFARKTTGQIFAIGEINSASMAAMAMDLSKIASQMFFSAHYITTEHMIADFVNAKLCKGGYSEELLAELDVVRCLGFDVHLQVKQGRRYVQWINEIVPKINERKSKYSTYEIRTIYQYDEEKEQGVLTNCPSEITYERAKQLLGKEEYLEFVRFFTG